ncbi:hypothetical protein C2E23DRAFT_271455 [Lenzites betulinus]|nr:hypothetical protein C2E23DRAFT_271455 [Lenzites betulinus]
MTTALGRVVSLDGVGVLCVPLPVVVIVLELRECVSHWGRMQLNSSTLSEGAVAECARVEQTSSKHRCTWLSFRKFNTLRVSSTGSYCGTKTLRSARRDYVPALLVSPQRIDQAASIPSTGSYCWTSVSGHRAAGCRLECATATHDSTPASPLRDSYLGRHRDVDRMRTPTTFPIVSSKTSLLTKFQRVMSTSSNPSTHAISCKLAEIRESLCGHASTLNAN